MTAQNRTKTVLTFAAVVSAILGLAAISASAATMSASVTAPAVDGFDIANYTDTGNLDKWFCLPNEWASRPVG